MSTDLKMSTDLIEASHSHELVATTKRHGIDLFDRIRKVMAALEAMDEKLDSIIKRQDLIIERLDRLEQK